jgi:mRNA interferase RelE/StbE
MEARYIVDENGKRVSVILPMEEYEHLIETLEDLEDVRAYDGAKAELEHGEDELVPWEIPRDLPGERKAKDRVRVRRTCRLSYRIAVGRSAEKLLRRRVPSKDAERLRRAIDDLEGSRPQSSRKLRGKGGRRIRAGEYRVFYDVDDERRAVTIIQVGHRRDVNRQG